jgi:shikimate dehydrogenase
MTKTATLKLGLIGDNIARSRSPLLHRLAGQQNGVEVTYDRLVPKDMALGFDEIFDGCARQGYHGINVTYPYKELGAKKVEVDDPLVRAVGAVNTVLFGGFRPKGFNTDYSGFMSAYRHVMGDAATGTVLMIGTGGVGRAVAFGLAGLGTRRLHLVDRDPAKAEALAEALKSVAPDMEISIWVGAEKAAEGCSGVINCTPVGMVGYEGTPLAAGALQGAVWAFDAVYTPVNTRFLQDAGAAGLKVISGWELYFYQGVHAWSLFSGLGLDEAALRASLIKMGDAE